MENQSKALGNPILLKNLEQLQSGVYILQKNDDLDEDLWNNKLVILQELLEMYNKMLINLNTNSGEEVDASIEGSIRRLSEVVFDVIGKNSLIRTTDDVKEQVMSLLRERWMHQDWLTFFDESSELIPSPQPENSHQPSVPKVEPTNEVTKTSVQSIPTENREMNYQSSIHNATMKVVLDRLENYMEKGAVDALWNKYYKSAQFAQSLQLKSAEEDDDDKMTSAIDKRALKDVTCSVISEHLKPKKISRNSLRVKERDQQSFSGTIDEDYSNPGLKRNGMSSDGQEMRGRVHMTRSRSRSRFQLFENK